jgi:hypothetical protein
MKRKKEIPSESNNTKQPKKPKLNLSKGLEYKPNPTTEQKKPTKYFPSLFSIALEAVYLNKNPTPISDAKMQKVEQLLDTVFSWDLKKRITIPHLGKHLTGLFPYITKLNLSNKIIPFNELEKCSEIEFIDLSYTTIDDYNLFLMAKNNRKLQVYIYL